MCPLPFFGYFFYNYPIFLFFRSLFFNFCLISLYSFKDTDSIFVKSLLMEFVGATNETLCKEFSSSMHKKFEMSMIGELNFFLGLQVKQIKHGTFLCQKKILYRTN